MYERLLNYKAEYDAQIFQTSILKYYPFSKDFILNNIEDLSNKFGSRIFYNERVLWNEELIEHSINFNPTALNAFCFNPNINWNKSLINKYQNDEHFSWSSISRNEGVNWNEILNSNNIDQLNWGEYGISKLKSFPWSSELITKYSHLFSWKTLSGNQSLPWSLTFIDYFIENWQWEMLGLSHNPKVPITQEIIDKYIEKWDWPFLSGNPGLPWTEELINRFQGKWRNASLSHNKGLPWTIDFFEEYIELWDWQHLSFNTGLPWSNSFIEKYESNWNFGRHTKDGLCRNEGVLWNLELIERYRKHFDNWSWWMLSQNKSIVWDKALFEKYSDYLDWTALAENKSFINSIFCNLEESDLLSFLIEKKGEVKEKRASQRNKTKEQFEDFNIIVQDGNWEAVGKKCLKYSLKHLREGNGNLFLQYMQIGYEFITCDCGANWLEKDESLYDYLSNINDIDSFSSLEKDIIYLFIFIHSNLPLDAIIYWEKDAAFRNDSEIESYENGSSKRLVELRYYLLGVAYGRDSEFQNVENSIQYFNKSINIRRTTKSLYKLGRIKENSEKSGIKELYEATCNNISSWCSSRWLKNASEKMNIRLKEYEQEKISNVIIKDSFNRSDNEFEFCKIFINLVQAGRYNLHNKTIFYKEAINIYLTDLIANKESFTDDYVNFNLSSYENVFFQFEELVQEAINYCTEADGQKSQIDQRLNYKPTTRHYSDPKLNVFRQILDENKIQYFYHFTDKSNLQSIIESGGLLSWKYCRQNSIDIPVQGGNELSQDLDESKGLSNYVRLSVCKSHPMMFVPPSRARNCVILKISSNVICENAVLFADRNATRNDARIGSEIENLRSIRFDVCTQNNPLNLNEEEKPFYQAEVLVYEKIPLEYITNISDFI